MDTEPIQIERRQKRPRGTGGLVHKKGSCNWYALWWGQDGRQHCASTGTSSKMRAEKKLQEILGRKAIGQLPPVEIAKLRYENLRDSLLRDYRINGHKSLYHPADGGQPYLTSLKHLDKFFDGRKVISITTDEIQRFVIERQRAGASNGTINRSLAGLRRMFSLAIRNGKLQAAPHIEMLKEASPRRGFLDPEDFRRLRMELPEHLRALVTVAFYTGMRLGEIRKLKWENVDLRADEIRLDAGETKNDEGRTIPLIDELPVMLDMLHGKHPPSEYVFGSDEPLGSFRKTWRSACVRAGLGEIQELNDGAEVYTGLIFHDLRRSGVRNLVRAGVTERVAMAISGHKTRAVFERYNITSKRDLKEAGKKLSAYFRTQGKAKPREHTKPLENDASLMKVQGIEKVVPA